MIRGELDAAGIGDQRLRGCYVRCRYLNAEHGRTYFLAARLLAPWQRPAVHALYGFARWIDDLVDESGPNTSPAQVEDNLERAAETLFAGLAAGTSDDEVIAAVVDTAVRFGIETTLFTEFIDSMRMDLHTTDYPDRAALERYVRGSAEAIGLQVLPVLRPIRPEPEAAERAAALGKAFQLTNFLRDVGEDLGRGRVYLPADELAAFDVDRDRLHWCLRNQRTDPRVRQALAYQVALTRAIYRKAAPGIDMLDPVSRPCVSAALTLYSEILDQVEDSDYAVFAHRAKVGTRRRAAVAGAGMARSWWTRRKAG